MVLHPKTGGYWCVFAIVLLAICSIIGCSKPVARTDNTLRLAIASDPKTFNYIVNQDATSGFVLSLAFEGLVRLDGVTMVAYPNLATAWQVDTTGTVWTFSLRKDVVWHDGTPFTADDVLFTFNQLIYNPTIPTSLRDVMQVSGKPFEVTKIDDYTVQFTLPSVFAPFLLEMTCPILPRHKLKTAVEKGAFSYHWGIDVSLSDIVGTGPFRLVRYVPGQYLLLEKNPRYWRQDTEGKTLPHIERIIVRILPDKNTELLSFLNGELDAIAIRAQDVKYVKDKKTARFSVYETGPGLSSLFMVLNQSVRAARSVWFRDETFRKAIAYAMDRQAMTEAVFYGRASPQYGPVSPANTVFYHDQMATYPYAPEKAIDLLSESFVRKEDGWFYDADGKRLSFTLLTNSESKERVALCNFIREDLKKIGVAVHVAPVQFNLLIRTLTTTDDWDAAFLGFSGGPDPHTGKNVWHTDGQLHLWNRQPGENITDWEQAINQLFEQGAKTLDETKRVALYARWQAIVADKLPFIYTVLPLGYYGVSQRVHPVKPSAFSGVLHNIEEWQLS